MKKMRADQAVTLYPPAIVALTPAQHAPRAHNLTVLDDEVPEGFVLCRINKAIQLKIGEVFYASDLPKAMASQVEEVVEPGEVSAADDVKRPLGKPAAVELDLDKMKAADLKVLLEENLLKAPAGTKKDAMVSMLRAHFEKIALLREALAEEGVEVPADATNPAIEALAEAHGLVIEIG